MAGTWTVSPVLGFLAALSGACRKSNVPKPASFTASPALRLSVIVSIKPLTVVSASLT